MCEKVGKKEKKQDCLLDKVCFLNFREIDLNYIFQYAPEISNPLVLCTVECSNVSHMYLSQMYQKIYSVSA